MVVTNMYVKHDIEHILFIAYITCIDKHILVYFIELKTTGTPPCWQRN